MHLSHDYNDDADAIGPFFLIALVVGQGLFWLGVGICVGWLVWG